MLNWKHGVLLLNEWINYQQSHGNDPTAAQIQARIWDMIFGTTLEEFRDSANPADRELYQERVREGEIEVAGG